MLARRDHSATELTRKLQQKKWPEEDIQHVITQLQAEGLQSNQRFIECYTRSRISKGYGPRRIQAELLNRGLSQEAIDHYLKMADNDWLTLTQKAWQKRFKGQAPRDLKILSQQMRFLEYRGFYSEHIKIILQSEDEHV